MKNPIKSKEAQRDFAAGAIGEGEAQELAEAIEARKALPPAAKAATSRCCGSRPRSSESLERRRRWCASGKLPPQLAARFTQAERSVLAVIAAEAMKRGAGRRLRHKRQERRARSRAARAGLGRGKAPHGLPQRHEHRPDRRAGMEELAAAQERTGGVTVHLPWVRQVPGGSLAVRLSGHTRRFL
jgi:hypothetical protein